MSQRRLASGEGFMLDRGDESRRALIIQLLCDLSVDMSVFSETWRIHFPDYFADALAEWVTFEARGLVAVEKDRLQITDSGRLVSRALVMPFDRYTPQQQQARFSRII